MRASPCISQPAASWHPRPSALRPTAGSGPDTRTPGTVEDGSAPCPAFRSPAVSPCGEEPCCFQISPAEETLELGRLVSPGNCDTLSPRAAGFYACHVRSLIPCRSTKGRWPLTASAAGLS
ncbi:TP53TG3F isoform 1, partial [Pan troglodytes]